MSLSKWVSDSWKPVHQWITDKVLVSKPLFYAGTAVAVGIISGAVYLYTNPERWLYWSNRLVLRSAGFNVKYAAGRKCVFCYAERGQLRSDKPSFLFIDRFGGEKESWMKLCKGLPSDVHIVCVELPGQGDTTLPVDLTEASLYKLTELLAEFAYLMSLDVVPHHVVGWSMGGSVAALYAAKYPQLVSRLTLIAPLMQCAIETEFWSVKDDPEHLSFLTDDPGELKALTEKLFYNANLAPQSLSVYKSMIKHAEPKKDFLTKLYLKLKEEVTDESSKYDDLVAKIKCPVQVIWGEQDQIVHVSGTSLIEELITTIKETSILPNCGHAVHMESTDTVRQLIIDFYNSI